MMTAEDLEIFRSAAEQISLLLVVGRYTLAASVVALILIVMVTVMSYRDRASCRQILELVKLYAKDTLETAGRTHEKVSAVPEKTKEIVDAATAEVKSTLLASVK